jgi:hypothetical protein
VHVTRRPHARPVSELTSPRLPAIPPAAPSQHASVGSAAPVENAPNVDGGQPRRLPGPPAPTGGGGLAAGTGGTAGAAVAAALVGLSLLVLPRVSRWFRLARDLAPAPVLLAALERPG